MTAVGDILKSSDPDRPDLRVLGATEAGEWIVRENDEFGEARTLEPDEFSAYGVTGTPERRSEQEGWNRLADGLRQPRRVLPERPLTPEQLLAAGEGTPVSADGDGWAGHPGVVFSDSAPWLRRAHAPGD
jgi:hypothetical protein